MAESKPQRWEIRRTIQKHLKTGLSICLVYLYMFNMYVHFRFGKHQALPNMDVVRYFKGFASENGWMSPRKMERTARTKRRSKPSHTWRVDHGKRLIWAWNTGIVSTQKKSLTSNGIMGILFQASDMRSQGIKLRTRGTVCLKIAYPWHEPTNVGATWFEMPI